MFSKQWLNIERILEVLAIPSYLLYAHTVLSAVHRSILWVLTKALGGRDYYYSHFTYEENQQERLRTLSKITQLVSAGGMSPVVWLQSLCSGTGGLGRGGPEVTVTSLPLLRILSNGSGKWKSTLPCTYKQKIKIVWSCIKLDMQVRITVVLYLFLSSLWKNCLFFSQNAKVTHAHCRKVQSSG